MLVNIAYIPKEQGENARKRAASLAKAIEDGDILLADTEGAGLLSLAADTIRIPETVWREFLAKLRETDRNFRADYLLTTEQQNAILHLDWDESKKEIIRIAAIAREKDGLVLELPLLEGDDDQL